MLLLRKEDYESKKRPVNHRPDREAARARKSSSEQTGARNDGEAETKINQDAELRLRGVAWVVRAGLCKQGCERKAFLK